MISSDTTTNQQVILTISANEVYALDCDVFNTRNELLEPLMSLRLRLGCWLGVAVVVDTLADVVSLDRGIVYRRLKGLDVHQDI